METETGRVFEWNVTDRYLTVTMLHPYYVYAISIGAVTVGIGTFSHDLKVITDEAG